MCDQMVGQVLEFDQPRARDLGIMFLPAGQGLGKPLSVTA